MIDATLRIGFAGPLVTYQDAGRPGHMRFGVSASGPMDRLSHATANAALGNPDDATTVEISMGGLSLECTSGILSLAITGADFTVERAGEKSGAWNVFSLEQGEKLTIRGGKAGSWAYLAFAGSVEAPEWLGKSATHSTSGFGGGQLVAGEEIHVSDARLREDRHGAIERPSFLGADNTVRVVMGPQDRYFTDIAIREFQSAPFTLTSAFDRMGVRLSGPKLDLASALSIPSEPISRGAIQVAGDGVPTILLADHQTTGGYPKIATVVSVDIGKLSQLRAGDQVKFVPIAAHEAIQIVRETADSRENYLATISEPKGTLEHRLMANNLISGAVSGDEEYEQS